VKILSLDGNPITPSPGFPAYLLIGTKSFGEKTERIGNSEDVIFCGASAHADVEIMAFSRVEVRIHREEDGKAFGVGDSVLHFFLETPNKTADAPVDEVLVFKTTAAKAGVVVPESVSLNVSTNKSSAALWAAQMMMEVVAKLTEYASTTNSGVLESIQPPAAESKDVTS